MQMRRIVPRVRTRGRLGAARLAIAVLAGAAALTAVATTAASTAAGSSSEPLASAAAAPPGGYITNFVKYLDGKPGTANPKLAPAYIGWSSNNSGGSVISVGPEASAAAQVTVDWINKYADGIDGHPLVLDNCIVLNAEEEGLACAEKFLDNPKVDVISYGALSVGAATIDSTVAGKKPIIIGFSINPSDITTKNAFVLFGAGGFNDYEAATFSKNYLHAKACAILYPNIAGSVEDGEYASYACKTSGLTTRAVPFDPTTSDLTGAVTAAGGTTPGTAVIFAGTNPSNCLAFAKAVNSLGIKPSMVLWFTQCQQPNIKAQYPGGDYPQYNSSLSQSGDSLVNDPTGQAFTAALSKVGDGIRAGDDWYSGMFGQIMTIAEFMNKIGYAKLSPTAVLNQVKNWRGPLLLGGPTIHCGEYKFAPGSCSDGNYFFRYLGNGKWTRLSGWLHPPPQVIAALKKLPVGAQFPHG
jgi:hypothetical protein